MHDLNITLPEVECRTNCRIKVYVDGSKNYMLCSNSIFKDPFYEDQQKIEKREAIFTKKERELMLIKKYLGVDTLKDVEPALIAEARAILFGESVVPDTDLKEVRYDSMKRAKDSIFDYILNNSFDYFFTGTINPELLDSQDSNEVLKPVKKWLENLVARYGLSYIMVAERHKSGAIHFHGLLKSQKPLKMVDSGTKLYQGYNKPVSNEKAEKLGLSGGRTVYNLANWRFGYSTAIKLTGDRMNTAFYVTKYITKDFKKIFGRFFWHSRDLKKPQIIYKNVDFNSFDALDYGGFKYRLDRSDNDESNGDYATL